MVSCQNKMSKMSVLPSNLMVLMMTVVMTVVINKKCLKCRQIKTGNSVVEPKVKITDWNDSQRKNTDNSINEMVFTIILFWIYTF